MNDGKVGYVIYMFDFGFYKFDLLIKIYKGFVNVLYYGCIGIFNFVYSLVNKYGFFDCCGINYILELDVLID